MNDFLKIKNDGASMALDAESSDKQEFGSFYLSRFLGFEISYKNDVCVVKFKVKSF